MSNDPTPPPARPQNRPPARVRVLVDDESKPPRRGGSWLHEDLPYVVPMLAFLLILQVGSTWKSLYAPMYVARTLIVPVILVVCWRRYTPIRWNGWWLGLLVGVLGIVQWVLMQRWLQQH